MAPADQAAWGLSPKDGRSLTRFVERTRGHGFKLAVVEVATAGQRARVLAGLQGLLGDTPLLTVALDQLPGENLWDELRARFPAPPADGLLVLWGLEEAGNRTEVLMQQLNVQRDLFVRDLRVPWVLFLHPGLATRLRSRAPDFCDLAILWVDVPTPEPVRPMMEFARGAEDARAVAIPDAAMVSPLVLRALQALFSLRLDAATDLLSQYHVRGGGSLVSDWFALVAQAGLSRARSDYISARSQIQRALALAEENRSQWQRGVALLSLAEIEAEQGNLRIAQRLLREALNREQPEPENFQFTVLITLARVELALGHVTEARRYLLQAQQLVSGYDNPNALAMLVCERAEFEFMQGEIEEAYRLAAEGMLLAGRERKHALQIRCLRILIEIALEGNRIQEARRRLKRIQVLETRMGHSAGSPGTLRLRAKIELKLGHIAEARPLLQQVLRIQEASGDRQGHAAALAELASLESHIGNLESARRLLRESLKIANDIGWVAQQVSAMIMLGQCEFATGNESEGRRLVQQAVALLEKLGSPKLHQARAILASLKE